jgi:steroid delta-isomerase-like uncharacterized protein
VLTKYQKAKEIIIMSPQELQANIERFFEEVLNKHDLDKIEEFIALDYKLHSPNSVAPVEGPNGYRQFIGSLLVSSPDITFRIEDFLGCENKAAVRWTSTGTHLGSFAGIPPTGKVVTYSGISIYQIDPGGKIAEERHVVDQLGLLQQLGVIPG